MVEELLRIAKINDQLLKVLTKLAYELIDYADIHNIEIPYKIQPLLDRAEKLIYEKHNLTPINQTCSVCGKLNLENADFCCYCGSSMNITRMRQQDDVTRNSDRTRHKVLCNTALGKKRWEIKVETNLI